MQHVHAISSKILLLMSIASVPAAGVTLVEWATGWYIQNQAFMAMVFLAIAIDHILGTWVHYAVKNDFSMRKNYSGLIRKGFGVCAGYVLFEMIHEIMKSVEFVALYLKVVIQLTVILWPVISALKNISLITNGNFPPAIWFTKFEGFQKDLDLNAFKQKNIQNETDNNYPPGDSYDAGMPEPQEADDADADPYGGEHAGRHGENRGHEGFRSGSGEKVRK